VLVLSRKKHERIIVDLPDGRTVEAMVVDIGNDRVRIGISAPRDVRIIRAELLDRAGESGERRAEG